jgi:hypothetical protein
MACFNIASAEFGEVDKEFSRRLNPTVLLSIDSLAGFMQAFNLLNLKG